MFKVEQVKAWGAEKQKMIIPIIYVLAPFLILDVGNIHMAHRTGLLLGLSFILATQIKNIWLKLFVFYVLGYFVYTFYLIVTHNIAYNSPLRHFICNRFIWFFTCFVFYLAIVNSKAPIEWFYNAICIGTLIQCLLVFIQLMGYNPFLYVLKYLGINIISKLQNNAGFGTLGNNNFVAAMIAISIPFFCRGYWVSTIPFLVFALALLKTSTAAIALTIGMIVFFGFTSWSIFVLAWGVLYVFFLDNNTHIAIEHCKRIKYWITIIKILLKDRMALLFGFGPGEILPKSIKGPAHNEWLEGLYHFGLTGMSFIMLYILTIYKQNKILLAALIIACVNALGNYPMHLAPSAALILIIMGLIQKEKILCEMREDVRGTL